MKTFTQFFMLIGVITLITFSCSNKKSEISKSTEEKRLDISKDDTITLKINDFFQLPSLQKLVDYSPVLNKEAFGTDEIRYIVGDVIILSANKEIAYLNLLPKTSEDDNYYIDLITQNWDTGKAKIIKKWTINNESNNVIVLADFYESYKEEINELFRKENVQPLNQQISFKTFDEIKNINIKSSFKNKETEFKELNKVEILSKNEKSIFLEQNSKNNFCPECDSLILYKADALGELVIEKQARRILVLGFLEQINQSPSALHLRFVDLKK